MKINKNVIVFIAVFLLIGIGFSGEYLMELKNSTLTLLSDIKSGYLGGVVGFSQRIDSISMENMRYYEALLDIHSLQNNLLNNKIVIKDDTTVIKSESDNLIITKDLYTEEEIKEVVDRIETIYGVANEHNIPFLYIAAPSKSYVNESPCNVEDYTADNFDRLVKCLNARDIPCLDLSKKLSESGMLDEAAFFQTDHHWKPHIGFWATEAICNELEARYDFDYNAMYTDLSNYTVKTYEDWFLGSYGKKAGRLFTFEGAEDIDWITPTFETQLTEKQPYKDQTNTGTFEEVLLKKQFIETKDCYSLNSYAAYSGGDFRLQIIENELNKNGKKIVMLRDSFACVVSPFLSLNTSELHVIDTRNFIPTERINVYDYIKNVKPDYVIILYSDVARICDAQSRYDYGE